MVQYQIIILTKFVIWGNGWDLLKRCVMGKEMVRYNMAKVVSFPKIEKNPFSTSLLIKMVTKIDLNRNWDTMSLYGGAVSLKLISYLLFCCNLQKFDFINSKKITFFSKNPLRSLILFLSIHNVSLVKNKYGEIVRKLVSYCLYHWHVSSKLIEQKILWYWV